MQLIKLNLGCGRVSPSIFTDHINVDLIKHPGVDVASDVTALPFANDYADEVYASHILEHFGTYQTTVVIKEWLRVLKPGGLIRIVVPNLINAFKIAENYCRDNGYDGEYLARVLYGGQNGETIKESISNSHRTGFDKKLLQKRAEEAGVKVLDCYYGEADDTKARHYSTWTRGDENSFNIFLIGHK